MHPRLRGALTLVSAALAFVIVTVVFVDVLQPTVKRWVADWIGRLGGTRPVALGTGAVIGGAAFWTTWSTVHTWRRMAWPARLTLGACSTLLILLALGLAPASRIATEARRQTLETLGDAHAADLVDAATAALILVIVVSTIVLVFRQRLRR